ncbi:MAG: Nif3-like dinuclear metal center hexameric protein [Planctomycetaceae bacterium]|jgi:dinuclear metal center YbgI/SA1388 family protein|nr:Nif3-like dinuclear metal center hexameric protein [bacterium]MDB4786609.1 Nif3-like dinuclear metal center hexameric protein [Planctomycetaceae bacterium]MDC0308392.1 Nif3-like dinuclear metal center hexameric protein [Planctomycetaceae bacterium]MDG2389448.1 Nif3-like dinuclear metal center hexameric protein [Planctomycetaceae bacterium]
MARFTNFLETLSNLAPLELAEEWDNVGLIVGRTGDKIERVMTCLTLTADVAEEAIKNHIDVIVTHHPIIFRPRQEITFDSEEGALLIRLIQANIAVYSPHTAYDSAKLGINAQLAELFELVDVTPIRPVTDNMVAKYPRLKGLGSGRIGTLPREMTLSDLASLAGQKLPTGAGVQFVGEGNRLVSKVGIACGSAAEFQGDARRLGADVLITGEARFHACLEARSAGISLVIAGHYATERPALETLARLIEQNCQGLSVTSSQTESDPLQLHS